MRTILFTVLSAFALLTSQAGCSKKAEKAETETSSQADTVKKPAQASYNYDSLATVRYPVRNEENKFVTLLTDHGMMTLELYRDVAPAHADSFVARTKDEFYDSTIFHRVMDKFMIQGGDTTGTGTGHAGYYLNAEFSDLPHKEGTLSMARSMDPNSASCQFFICLDSNRMTASLDRQYTIFGHLVNGYDILHKVGSVECVPRPPRGEKSKPKEDVYLLRAYLSDAEGKEVQ